MERRFRVRLAQLLDDAHVPPDLLRGLLPRLQTFLQPFLDALPTPQQQTNAHQYVQGLLSDLGSKDVESIAYLHDRERQGLQKFIGQADWDYQPLLTELARQVGTQLGQADGVLVFDPSAFPKKGSESVGVQRQWCGLNQRSPNARLSSARNPGEMRGHCSAVTLTRCQSFSPCHSSWNQPRLPNGVDSATSVPWLTASMGRTEQ